MSGKFIIFITAQELDAKPLREAATLNLVRLEALSAQDLTPTLKHPNEALTVDPLLFHLPSTYNGLRRGARLALGVAMAAENCFKTSLVSRDYPRWGSRL